MIIAPMITAALFASKPKVAITDDIVIIRKKREIRHGSFSNDFFNVPFMSWRFEKIMPGKKLL